jgi:mannose-1-phosphate guanylyltransferase
MAEDARPDAPLSADREVPDQVSGRAPGQRAPFVPVVPAGGSGTRLWPLSRRDRPKFLLDPTGRGCSLLQGTLRRVASHADRPTIVVTGQSHAAAVREQAGPDVRILTEPAPRDSMPAIALAAAVAELEDPDAVIGSFPADHLIGDEQALSRAIDAARAAAARGYLVTIGIEPTRPATGFGYIERADEESTPPTGLPGLEGTGALPVASFVEKPDAERAQEFLADGLHLWNAGMFVVGARVLLDALAEQIPPLAAGVRRIARARAVERPDAAREQTGEPRDEPEAELTRIWPTLTRIAIDHALAEPLAAQGRVAVVPADLDWDDVGDFAALARQLRRERQGASDAPTDPVDAPAGTSGEATGDHGDRADVVAVGGARTIGRSSRATVYGSSQRPIALVGLDAVSVVETDDVLLIAADSEARALGELVGGLEDEGYARLR